MAATTAPRFDRMIPAAPDSVGSLRRELRLRVSHRSRGVPSPPVGVGYGFGLALIARVCDRFEVRRRDDRPGTALLMIFRLDPELQPERSSRLRPSHSSLRR